MVEARFSFGYWKTAKPGPHVTPKLARGLAGEEIVPGAFSGKTGRDVARSGQIPGLGVAVALVADADGAMHVRDNGHRTGVLRVLCIRIGELGKWHICLASEIRAHVAACCAAGRVGPVQGRVDRQEVGHEIAIRVLEIVDPLDAHRRVPLSLDGQRWGIMEQQPSFAVGRHGAVTPDSAGRQACGENLLRKLFHRDLVVVDVLAPPLDDPPCRWHHGRDEQRSLELLKRRWVKCPPRDLCDRPGNPELVESEQRQCRASGVFQECASCNHGFRASIAY